MGPIRDYLILAYFRSSKPSKMLQLPGLPPRALLGGYERPPNSPALLAPRFARALLRLLTHCCVLHVLLCIVRRLCHSVEA